MLPIDIPLSVVSELVAALRNEMSFCGLVSTSRERTSRTIAAMSFCWLPMRLVSEPSPTPWPLRARA